MVLQLHVWGPAFSLPSIDAQCLAVIAYCSEVLPKDSWELVPTSDPSVSPTGELPALQNGSVWVSRFRNIVDYLRQWSEETCHLDQFLNGVQQADSVAFSSFIESRGQPLLDLYLFVTSQNYYGNTSPAYGSLLQWPNQWILPPKLHAAAKARTEHLGLSSLDLQAMEDQRKRDHSAAVASGQIPANLIQTPQETVSKLLGRTAKTNHFRLDALTADFFEPLEAMLAKKEVLLPADDENNPSSLDCLAIGYLSLALKPDLAFPWLRDAMRTKAPLLTAYAERMHARVFVALPWREPERISVSAVGSTLLNLAADNTPFLSEIRANRRLKSVARNESFSTVQKQALSQYLDAKNLNMWVSVASVIAGGAALVGYMVHVGLISISGHGEEFEEQEEEFEPGGVVHMPATDFLGAL